MSTGDYFYPYRLKIFAFSQAATVVHTIHHTFLIYLKILRKSNSTQREQVIHSQVDDENKANVSHLFDVFITEFCIRI